MPTFRPRRSLIPQSKLRLERMRLNQEVDNARDTLMTQFLAMQQQQPESMSYPDNTDSGNWDSASQEDFDYESIGSAAPGAAPNPYTPTWHADGSLGKNRH